ncbi:hypothetical protein [Lentiprolixibacter aurantiacus]|uniref:Cytochrome c domain-containing protein n=1 Tax=Lentiprolixibacter aurantiacus TaxID=2993939 RepID=A0AAE3SP03_9FLAO|nr:hypothetical protein [Lentiprolixibacter aurantiacus]MCX2720327.1 hypothetical protein [Lentiprolixibacter aurantiacus]
MRALLFFAILAFVVSCKEQPKKADEAVSMSAEALAEQGEKLMTTYCYQCHNPNTSRESMLGPPMIGIKKHYITDSTTKEAFVADLLSWMKGPKEENSKMPHALEKFGLMNHQVYPDSVIIGIAEYMYDNEIEKPEWYQQHHREMHGSKDGTGHRHGQKKGDQ